MNEEELTKEVLRFVGNDEECTHLIFENNTTIFSSPGSHTKGSSKLTLRNFVNFNWDLCYYRGQLIALHVTEKYVAYAFSKPGTFEGLVRVVKRETNDRILIKGFSSFVEDLKFAHLHEIIMLACVDQTGTVYIYTIIDDQTNVLKAKLVFQIIEDPSHSFKNKHLLSWCQYIPEQTNCLKELEFRSTYNGKMLAVVRGSEVEVWHIGLAINYTKGPVCGNFDLNKLDDNVLNNIKKTIMKLTFQEFDIINVAFSSDGSNISLALENGTVLFYDVSFEQPPQCIYPWKPTELHNSLISMAFLDNHKQLVGESNRFMPLTTKCKNVSFEKNAAYAKLPANSRSKLELWKYVVTLTINNELLLWSCLTWSCLQKLTFVRCSVTTNPMKLTVDETGKLIFLSDIDCNLLYVLEVASDFNSPEKNIKVVSVSEILLQSPMLNMIIVDAKINHNDVNSSEQSNYGNSTSENTNKFTTIINLFAIQPKSIQEGQLIVSSPEFSIMEQLNLKPKNPFPRPPSITGVNNTIDLPKNDKNEELITKKDNANNLADLSSMDLHKLVKEKLKVRGVNIIKKNVQRSTPHIIQPDKKKNNFIKIEEAAAQLPKDNTFPQLSFDTEEARECSPSNNEVQTILHNQELNKFEYKTIPLEESEFYGYDHAGNYPNGNGKEEHQYTSSVFNGSSISTIRNPNDKNEMNSNGIGSQADMSSILACLDGINGHLESMSKKQTCANDQTLIKLQKMIDQQLSGHLVKVADIVKNSNKVDTDLFTKTLVTSLSPTLDAILKDLFMSTVIPKFEHACCSMFKQIDASFTERSLEYQNELKILLSEEGNINGKLECAFDKFKSDVSSIVKNTETNILSAQNDMQKQFSTLMKEKSLSLVESYVKDSENVAHQLNILGSFIDRGELAPAFEKALSASNLDLVLFVCERVSPEDVFQPPCELKPPIVLSLIQQLSHELTMNTELKYKYLDDAVGSLDYQNDLYKENINLVLQKMEKNVEKFLQQYPYHAYIRKFKMLQFAVKSIINNIKNQF